MADNIGSSTSVIARPIPPARTQAVTPAQLQQERVAGSTALWLWRYLQALTQRIDELEQTLGDDVYYRMMYDPACRAAVDNLKRGVLAPEVRFLPGAEAAEKGEEGYEKYRRALDVAAFVTANVKRLRRPSFRKVLWALLDAVAFGNKVVEIVLEEVQASDFPDAGEYLTQRGGPLLVLSKLKARPKRSVAFVVDAYMNCVGLLALSPGMGATFGLLAPLTLVNPQDQKNFIPRDKFLIYSHDPQNEDPRGTSCLRAAYGFWNDKLQIMLEWLKHLARFGSPSIVGKLAQAAQGQPILDSTGAITFDATTGAVAVSNPAQDMVNALIQLYNGAVAVVQSDEDVQVLEPQHEGDCFLRGIAECDRQIEKAVTGQNLATSEGKHNARAAAETHSDTKATASAHIRTELEEAVYELSYLLTLVNYGPAYLDVVPVCSVSEAEQQDLPGLWTAFAALDTAGSIKPSMRKRLCAQVDLPTPSDADVKADQELAAATLDQTLNPPEPAQQPGAKPQPAGAGATS